MSAGLSIRAAAAGLRSGALSAEALMRRALERQENFAARLNVFAARADAASLLEQAAAVDRALARGVPLGPLAGIPVAVKDIYDAADLPTTASSKVLAGRRAARDSAVVARLRAAGAIIVGMTQTHEFAYGPTTANEYAGPSRNPWNEAHVPGGSSGGSAIAVATGMCLGATGSDTGGSIRTPSGLCGTAGLKPTFGLVSRRGVLSLSWSLDHAGPIAASSDDLAVLLHAMAGHDPADPGSALVPIPDYPALVAELPRRLAIGVPQEHFFDLIDGEVAAAFEAALDVFRSFGWSVEPVSLPRMPYATGAELAILTAEATEYHRERLKAQAADYSSDVRVNLDAGAVLLATDYLRGQRVRRLIIEDHDAAFRRVDILATPTLPIVAPPIGAEEITVGGRTVPALEAIWRNVFPANLTGAPALSVRAGFSADGLPIGLQLTGRAFEEATLLAAGHAYEQATPWRDRRPPLLGG